MGQRPRELTPNASAAHLFGSELRRARTRRGLSLADLASRFGEAGRRVHASYLGNVETGERLPDDGGFAEIADDVLATNGLLGRLWGFADVDRQRSKEAARQERQAILDLLATSLSPVVSGEVVLVPYPNLAGTVSYMKMSRRAFMSTGGLTAAAFATSALASEELDRVLAAMDEPQRSDRQVAEYFRRMLALHKANDYVEHPSLRMGSAVQQVGVLERLARDARRPAASSLRSVQAEYAEYVGWLHQEIGNTTSAVHWTDKAIGWAHAGGYHQMVSFSLGRKVNIAYWAGQPQAAASLAVEARHVPWPLPPGLASVNLEHEARAHALAGDEVSALRALDDAGDLLARRQASGEDTIWWAQQHTEDHRQEHLAHCYTDLSRPGDAVQILRRLLPERDAGRRHAGPLSVLALAHARNRDPRNAVAAGEEAMGLNMSACTLMVLDSTSQELGRWDSEEFVRTFRGRVAQRRHLLKHGT